MNADPTTTTGSGRTRVSRTARPGSSRIWPTTSATKKARAVDVLRARLGVTPDLRVQASLAAIEAAEGRREAARWLTDAANTGFPCYPWFMKDPLLEPFRATAQFRRLVPALWRTFEGLAVRYGS